MLISNSLPITVRQSKNVPPAQIDVIGMAGEIRGHSKKARFCFAAFDSKIEKDSLRERFSIANYVVDAIMGAGKTTAAVNKINTSRGPFIYVTPYLDEVKRIIKACPRQKFKEPRAYGYKLKDFKELLKKGTNIATTHALFENFDLEIVDILNLKISVAYPVNKYMNPIIKNFFVRQGVEVDEEAFALSEMLQFIWRSGIRDGKDISLYVQAAE